MTARKLASLLLLSASLLAAVPAVIVAQEEGQRPVATRVEAMRVCMVNDAVFNKDLIPVEVKGKTYFGCCEMCKERLAKDPASRSAADPVTGKSVDKAVAVIGALPDGSVLYFESAATLEAFNSR
jgi:YHS domain-containing protein